MGRKIGISIGVIILIPLLVYIALAIGNDVMLGIYVGIHHINIHSISKSEIMNIMQSKIYYGSAIGEFLSVILLLIIFLIPKEGLIKRCKFKKFEIKKFPVIFMFMLGFAFISIVFIHLTQGDVTSYKNVEKEMIANASTVLGGVLLVIIIPIFEEMIFRGAIFGTLRKQMPWIAALIIQGIIFSLMHGNLIQSAYTFPLGIILGLIFIYAGSMFGDIIGHMTFNLFGVYLIPILSVFYYNSIVYLIIGIVLIICAIINHKYIVKNC